MTHHNRYRVTLRARLQYITIDVNQYNCIPNPNAGIYLNLIHDRKIITVRYIKTPKRKTKINQVICLILKTSMYRNIFVN